MNTQQLDDYFGVCPCCGKHDGFINVGRSHWFFCKEHRIKWCAGSNLFSSWRDQTEDEQRHIYDEIGLGGFKPLVTDRFVLGVDGLSGFAEDREDWPF